MQMEMKIWRKNLQRPTSTWEKMQRYQHSELCEVSDPEARMELHNGVSEPGSDEQEPVDDS